jgi:uncharacterized protein YjbI with pentapeptide repeats
MDPIDRLKAGDVAGFHRARKDRGRIDLFAEDLAGLTLAGVDLSNAVLTKSDLTGSDLSEATLHGAVLDEIDGAGLVLRFASGLRTRLRGAYLEDADLSETELPQVDLAGATLTGARLDEATLTGARLGDVEATGASFVGADLTEAALKGAVLAKADLTRARLGEAKAGGVVLSGARLDGVEAAQVRLSGAKLDGASLTGARLTEAQLVEADLSGANLSQADLGSANLSGARLVGADLRHASLVDACLDGADLAGANLAGADLTGIDPIAIGLDDTQRRAVAASGARFDPAAPLVFSRLSAAIRGPTFAIAWKNPDTPEAPTLRWAVQEEGVVAVGVLPLSANLVHAHEVLATEAGLRLVVLVERPDGFVVQSWPLAVGGVSERASSTRLPDAPLVPPVLRVEGGAVWMWTLTREGPTLRVWRDKLDGAGFAEVRREVRPQLVGFLGGSSPVILGKGGVAMAVLREGAGPPRRLPEGFPGEVAGAVAVGDGLVTVGFQPRSLRRSAEVVLHEVTARGVGEAETLAPVEAVTAVDVSAAEDGVRVAWVEKQAKGARASWTTWRGARPEVEHGPTVGVGLAGVRWLSDPAAPGAFRLLLAVSDGRLAVVDARGELVTTLAPAGVAAATRALRPPEA